MISALKNDLESIFKDIQISAPEDDRLIINAQKDAVLTILKFFKDKGYDHLAMISCTDWIEEDEFELIYIVGSYSVYAPAAEDITSDKSGVSKEAAFNGGNILLKTRISRKDPRFITAIPVFENSEPYEREIHELFGVDFKGHPRLTPLFLEREYKIPPFRKDFDTRRYVKDFFDQIPFVENKEK
ncbi:MAG: NADH-quinone oxidoreductase subunit C [Deltaproteobacteria bacterium]|nr:NADH-quinone oxidoreductase subunit C [Deltaproteobacteria bacterium]